MPRLIEIRFGPRRRREHLVAALDLGDHGQVGLQVQQGGEGAADDVVVVRQKHLDHALGVSVRRRHGTTHDEVTGAR